MVEWRYTQSGQGNEMSTKIGGNGQKSKNTFYARRYADSLIAELSLPEDKRTSTPSGLKMLSERAFALSQSEQLQ